MKDDKPCYGLVLGEVEWSMKHGDCYHSKLTEISAKGEYLREYVFKKGTDQKSVKKYIKLLDSTAQRNKVIDFEFDFLKDNPYVPSDIIDFVTKDDECLEYLIAVIFTKMMTLHGRALFALGGESEHYSKETDDIKEMFVDFFKNISEKYLPMIHI